MSLESGSAMNSSRPRVLVWTAMTVLAIGLLYHGILRPARRAIEGKRTRVEANARLLAALPEAGDASLSGALRGKSLARLSAGRVVQGLTDLAHWTEIRRVTFTTREVTALEGGAREGVGRAARLPVTVWLEAPAGAFAIYLDGLGALPWPVRVKAFEMKRAPQAAEGMRIRLDLEIYGLAT